MQERVIFCFLPSTVDYRPLTLPSVCVCLSLLPYLFTSFPKGKSVGLSGGLAAISSSLGYCCRRGSGTFPLGRLRMLVVWRPLPHDFPLWRRLVARKAGASLFDA